MIVVLPYSLRQCGKTCLKWFSLCGKSFWCLLNWRSSRTCVLLLEQFVILEGMNVKVLYNFMKTSHTCLWFHIKQLIWFITRSIFSCTSYIMILLYWIISIFPLKDLFVDSQILSRLALAKHLYIVSEPFQEKAKNIFFNNRWYHYSY